MATSKRHPVHDQMDQISKIIWPIGYALDVIETSGTYGQTSITLTLIEIGSKQRHEFTSYFSHMLDAQVFNCKSLGVEVEISKFDEMHNGFPAALGTALLKVLPSKCTTSAEPQVTNFDKFIAVVNKKPEELFYEAKPDWGLF